METDQMASSVSELQAIIKNIDGEISRLQTLIVGEDDKMLRYKVRPGSSTSFKCSFVFVNSYGYIQERAGFWCAGTFFLFSMTVVAFNIYMVIYAG